MPSSAAATLAFNVERLARLHEQQTHRNTPQHPTPEPLSPSRTQSRSGHNSQIPIEVTDNDENDTEPATPPSPFSASPSSFSTSRRKNLTPAWAAHQELQTQRVSRTGSLMPPMSCMNNNLTTQQQLQLDQNQRLLNEQSQAQKHASRNTPNQNGTRSSNIRPSGSTRMLPSLSPQKSSYPLSSNQSSALDGIKNKLRIMFPQVSEEQLTTIAMNQLPKQTPIQQHQVQQRTNSNNAGQIGGNDSNSPPSMAQNMPAPPPHQVSPRQPSLHHDWALSAFKDIIRNLDPQLTEEQVNSMAAEHLHRQTQISAANPEARRRAVADTANPSVDQHTNTNNTNSSPNAQAYALQMHQRQMEMIRRQQYYQQYQQQPQNQPPPALQPFINPLQRRPSQPQSHPQTQIQPSQTVVATALDGTRHTLNVFPGEPLHNKIDQLSAQILSLESRVKFEQERVNFVKRSKEQLEAARERLEEAKEELEIERAILRTRVRGLEGQVLGLEGDLAREKVERNRLRFRLTVFEESESEGEDDGLDELA